MKNRIVAGVVVLLLTMGCVTNLPLRGKAIATSAT
jgi:hypothetical protein